MIAIFNIILLPVLILLTPAMPALIILKKRKETILIEIILMLLSFYITIFITNLIFPNSPGNLIYAGLISIFILNLILYFRLYFNIISLRGKLLNILLGTVVPQIVNMFLPYFLPK